MYWDYILNKNFHHLLAVNKIEVSAALHGKTNVNKQIYKDKSYRRVFFKKKKIEQIDVSRIKILAKMNIPFFPHHVLSTRI